MHRSPMRTIAAVMAAFVLLSAPACSSDDDGGDAGAEVGSDTTVAQGRGPTPPTEDAVTVPDVRRPASPGNGAIVLGPGGLDLAQVGYVEEEFVVAGTATAYTSATPLGSDGRWDVTADQTAPFTTRIVVRRPADAGRFNGTVFVEWLNVSGGLDADPMFSFASVELVRQGAAWVGVSAQRTGIEGGGNSLGAALALKNADPARYAELSHPGDDWSYDIYTQAGAAVWFRPEVLDAMEPRQVIAMGESQSAFRLSTYVNAVAPTTQVYDGYLQHSRADAGAPLATEPRTPVPAPEPTRVRTDLDEPVFVVTAESDVVGDRLGYVRARQPDTDRFRSWEIAGTAHADAYSLGIGDADAGNGTADQALFDAMRNPPTGVYGGVIQCDSPINAGPHTYVLRAALRHLDEWVRSGTEPPRQPPLDVAPGDQDLVRNRLGIAEGGIRTPQVDVPVAVLSGLGQTGSSFCFLFGTTGPFDAATLAAEYPDHETFVQRWNEATDRAVAAGVVLEDDAEHIKQAAAASDIGR
jgi:hypothetical protein